MSNINSVALENPLDQSIYLERRYPKGEDIRGTYFRDQTAIVHSLPFRRLKHKAQLFFSPNNDHVCTRIEHALHVATVAATISRGLGLDEQLAYAIGLSHDLGHAPFGHAGEQILHDKTMSIGGFMHEIHGLRVVDLPWNKGHSLNLSYAVRDGIVCHCGESLDQRLVPRTEYLDLASINKIGILPSSYEGCVARISDRIAYLGRDLEDALYGGFMKRSEMPNLVDKELGHTNGEIIDSLVIDVIETSKEECAISLSDEKYEVLKELHQFCDEVLYKHDELVHYRQYGERIIATLFDYICHLFNKWETNYEKYELSRISLDKRFGNYLKGMELFYESEGLDITIIARDYVAGMTDGYALKCMKEISLPEEICFDKYPSNRTAFL